MSPAVLAEIGPGPATRRERQLWGALLLVALLLRLFALGDRPLHHDESIHAWFSDHLLHTGEYKYDPVYHGPIQYFAVASSFLVLGGSDFSSRLPAALGGTALVAMAFLLRRRFGVRAAFAAGVLIACSPNLLYFTRFCREDVWSLLGTAGALLFFDEWLATRRLRDLMAASLLAAVAFASKENFYVLLALLVPSVAAVFWEPGQGIVFWPRIRRLVDFLEANTIALAGALLLFFVVSELCYTLLLVHPESGNPAFQAISYWWGQHSIQRVGGPKTYYLPRLLQYEFALLIPAFLWVWKRRREVGAAERFLVTMGVASLGMYAYLGE
ncbi:MAG TPA: flippase activity-associated protein Agl23, partial [Thermoanaerobaculia bacterium]